MIVEITLKDDQGDPALMLSNCINPEFVNINFILEGTNLNVNTEELKTALRKICLK